VTLDHADCVTCYRSNWLHTASSTAARAISLTPFHYVPVSYVACAVSDKEQQQRHPQPLLLLRLQSHSAVLQQCSMTTTMTSSLTCYKMRYVLQSYDQ
jgi:hypothetical protein